MQDQEISIFPEQTVVYAGFWQRVAAVIIDGLVLMIPGIIIHRFVGGTFFFYELFITHDVSTSSVLGQAITGVTGWLYMAILESGPMKASLGKQAMGIQVTDLYGHRISFAKATGRHFGKYLSDITLLLGYFMMLWDEKNQTLHDKMAGTLIVKKQQAM